MQPNDCSVCGGPAVPEAGTEVIAARHEAWVSGRVHDAAHNIIMAKWEQVLPLSRARVPTAQADRSLIRQQHIVLCVIKDALRAVCLTATQSCSCNTHTTGNNYTTTRTNILVGKQVFWVVIGLGDMRTLLILRQLSHNTPFQKITGTDSVQQKLLNKQNFSNFIRNQLF